MPKTTGLFLMFDGIAGSSKTTILSGLQGHLESNSLATFALQDWFADHSAPPMYQDVSKNDVFFTFEPTRAWTGAAIRHELSRSDNPYPARTLAQAFALDRYIMYKRLIIPALRDGKTIIQDRGVSTSLVYQPVMDETISLKDISTIEGNALALRWAPDHLIITDISAETAHGRLKKRNEESRGVFAKPDALKRWNDRFHSDWLRKLFETHGTKIHTIDTSKNKQRVIKQANTLVTSLLSTQ